MAAWRGQPDCCAAVAGRTPEYPAPRRRRLRQTAGRTAKSIIAPGRHKANAPQPAWSVARGWRLPPSPAELRWTGLSLNLRGVWSADGATYWFAPCGAGVLGERTPPPSRRSTAAFSGPGPRFLQRACAPPSASSWREVRSDPRVEPRAARSRMPAGSGGRVSDPSVSPQRCQGRISSPFLRPAPLQDASRRAPR